MEDNIVIESLPGMCCSSQSKVSPDRFIISKEDYEVIDKSFNDQDSKKIIGEGRLRDVDLGKNPKISENMLIKTARVATDIENILGFDVDIEWSIDNNNLHILQARPITTLGK